MKDSDKRGDGGEAEIGKVKYNVQGTRYTLPSELVQNTAIVSD